MSSLGNRESACQTRNNGSSHCSRSTGRRYTMDLVAVPWSGVKSLSVRSVSRNVRVVSYDQRISRSIFFNSA